MNRSFVKSAGSESLKSLFKKEGMSKERQERFALGHRRGKLSKTYEKYESLVFCPRKPSFKAETICFYVGYLCPTIYVASVNFSGGDKLNFPGPIQLIYHLYSSENF